MQYEIINKDKEKHKIYNLFTNLIKTRFIYNLGFLQNLWHNSLSWLCDMYTVIKYSSMYTVQNNYNIQGGFEAHINVALLRHNKNKVGRLYCKHRILNYASSI